MTCCLRIKRGADAQASKDACVLPDSLVLVAMGACPRVSSLRSSSGGEGGLTEIWLECRATAGVCQQ